MREVSYWCWYLLAFAFGFTFGAFVTVYLIFYVGDFT